MHKVNLSSIKDKKIGLVLSGGIVKASAWHMGVTYALEDLGFNFISQKNQKAEDKPNISTYVGSSAGSFINQHLATGFKPLDVINAYVKPKESSFPPVTYKDMLSLKKHGHKSTKTDNYDPLEGFPFVISKIAKPFAEFSGFFSTAGLSKYIKENIITSDSFADYSADIFVVATQLDHSRKVVFGKYNYPPPHHDSTVRYYTDISICDAISSSMSVPPFYVPYPLYNPQTQKTDLYIDGEIRETLSSHVAVDNGCEVIINSWTHTPYHYHDEIGSLVNYGLPAICTQALYLMIEKKIQASRDKRFISKDLIDTINTYLKDNKFDESHRKKITHIIERKLNYRKDVKFIDISPKPHNYKLFLMNSFSLNPNKLAYLVNAAYKRTMEVFLREKWLD